MVTHATHTFTLILQGMAVVPGEGVWYNNEECEAFCLGGSRKGKMPTITV